LKADEGWKDKEIAKRLFEKGAEASPPHLHQRTYALWTP